MATQGDIAQVTNNSVDGYCKMPDGTLICWGFGSIPANNDRISINYPVTFTSYPRVSITICEDGYSGIPALYSWQHLFATLWVINRGAQQTKAIGFDWLAIGRWK